MPNQSEEPLNLLPMIMPLAGVLIGGLITFLYQTYFRWRDRRRLRFERLHRLHRFTFGLFNELLVLHKHVVQGVPTPATGPLWCYIQPLTGYSSAFKEYALDDLIMLSGNKFTDLSNGLPILAEERNAVVAALNIYNVRRTELLDELGPYMIFGTNGAVTFNPAYNQVPKIVRLQAETLMLANALVQDLNTARENVYRLNPQFNEMLAHYFKKKKAENPRIDLPKK